LGLATGKQEQKDKQLRISEIYQHAGRISPALHSERSTLVHIVEGPLLPKEPQMMVCICAHFVIPSKYHQTKESLG